VSVSLSSMRLFEALRFCVYSESTFRVLSVFSASFRLEVV
jgi:hypothetical protein